MSRTRSDRGSGGGELRRAPEVGRSPVKELTCRLRLYASDVGRCGRSEGVRQQPGAGLPRRDVLAGFREGGTERFLEPCAVPAVHKPEVGAGMDVFWEPSRARLKCSIPRAATSLANHDGEHTVTSKLSHSSLMAPPTNTWALKPKCSGSDGSYVSRAPSGLFLPPNASTVLTSAEILRSTPQGSRQNVRSRVSFS